MKAIKDYSFEELEAVLAKLGQPPYRAKQLYEWLYVKRVEGYAAMTNVPASLRSQLKTDAPFTLVKAKKRLLSSDGTRKYLFELHDGESIETVAIPSNSERRLTVCVSTQVGCAMQCRFCATGQEGFTRNLSPGEIIDQVLAVEKDTGARVSNLVVMGQGEPFLNYDSVLQALRVLNDSHGVSIGARHITVSTCGICSGIERFAQEPEQFVLAVSLHSARQYTRDLLMPKMKEQPLESLKIALATYCKYKNRRVSLEYLLLDSINDQQEDLDALLAFCKGLFCHINFLTMNGIEGIELNASPEKIMNHWIDACTSAGIEATHRTSRGTDIEGACGQLKGRV